MLKFCYFILLACILTACGQRSMPPEIAIVQEERKQAPPRVLKSEVIIVDAGHGGKDAGASSKREAYEEKTLTLSTATMICYHLNQLGYKTVMTRNQDVFIPLDTRAEMANNLKADLFVSIHYNYSPSEDAQGVEVYYYKETKTPTPQRITFSKQLGQEVLSRIVKQTGAHSRGVKQANFAVIRETTMPAILVEGGFLSNAKERNKLQDPHYRGNIAKGIAAGVDQYLASKNKTR